MTDHLDPNSDVAILVPRNPSVEIQLLRLGRACARQGLSVQFLVPDLLGDPTAVGRAFESAGFAVRAFHVETWDSGLFRYPSPPAALRLLGSLRRSLRGFRPRVLVTHADAGALYRVVHVWARESGVVGAVLQEGVAARLRPGYSPHSNSTMRRIAGRVFRLFGPGWLKRQVSNNLFAEHALVWGPAMRNKLVKAGRDPQTIHVVGSPAFDHVEHRYPLPSAGLRTVLFAQQHQPNADFEKQACRHIVQVCADIVECRLLLRPHPRGYLTRQDVVAMASTTKNPSLVETADSGDLLQHLHRASVFLSYYSTSAYHAVVYGVPLVLANWVSPAFELDAPEYGAALSVAKPEDLEPALRAALEDAHCRQALYEGGARWLAVHLGQLDGGASDRCAAAIARLAGRSGGD